jgi:hypothetical protein
MDSFEEDGPSCVDLIWKCLDPEKDRELEDGETKGREIVRLDDVSSRQRWFWQTRFFEPSINSSEGRDKTGSLKIHNSHAQVSHGAEPFDF